jgi:hypothetical protein
VTTLITCQAPSDDIEKGVNSIKYNLKKKNKLYFNQTIYLIISNEKLTIVEELHQYTIIQHAQYMRNNQ